MVLPNHDYFKDIHRHHPTSNHQPKDGHLDPLRHNGHHTLHRNRLLLCHPLPMLAHIVFLEHEPRRKMRQPRRHHRPHLSIQCLQCHLRLHLRHPAHLLDIEAQHGKEDQACCDSSFRHGLRVSNYLLSSLRIPAHTIQG